VPAASRDRTAHQRLDHAALFGAVTRARSSSARRRARTTCGRRSLSLAGPPGPVHLDLDPTALGTPIVGAEADGARPGRPRRGARTLRTARRPVVIAGVGATASACGAFVRGSTVRAHHLQGQGHRPGDRPERGDRHRGDHRGGAPARADLVVGVGLDPVELIPAPWSYAAPVVLLGTWPTVGDGAYFGDHLHIEVVVPDLDAALGEVAPELRSDWPDGAAQDARRAALDRVLAAVPDKPSGVLPQAVVAAARALAPAGTVATVDAGAHMLAAVPMWEVEEPGELLISSGLATMGFALPARWPLARRPDRKGLLHRETAGWAWRWPSWETRSPLARRHRHRVRRSGPEPDRHQRRAITQSSASAGCSGRLRRHRVAGRSRLPGRNGDETDALARAPARRVMPHRPG
jgi:acetolactate synthase-1/2/3 large subunit